MAFQLVNTHTLVPQPKPVQSYTEALQRLELLKVKDTAQVNSLCAIALLTHSQKMGRAVVFLHGFTNCPRQFLGLDQQFIERGYNVLLGRLPYHGYADRLSTEVARLTAEELAAFTSEVADLGRGLDEHLTVGGISAGAVAAAREKRGGQVNHYKFPTDLHLEHDLIDPNQPGQRTGLVYPKLLELAEAT